MPSWKKVISSGSAAHLLNITASNLPNIYKNNVLMYDTASGVITYFSSSLDNRVYVQQSGSVKYNNTAQTLMTNTTVTLMDSNGTQIVPPTITDSNGNFNFARVPIGNYYVQFQTNKPWGGVTNADAGAIENHFNTVELLTGIRQLAADVDADGDIDNTDYSQVNNRISNSIGLFTAGDWVFGSGSGTNFRGWRMIAAQPISPSLGVVSSFGIPLTASVNNTNLQYLALCTGDVNGSYIPALEFEPEINI